jgi:hypothetical protein
MKITIQLFVVFITSICNAQNGDTFIFIQDHLHVDHNFVLSKSDFDKYKNEISIDSSKIHKYGQYNVCIVKNGSTEVDYYKLLDSSGLILGNARDLLKRMEFQTGIGVEWHFTSLIADSLRKANTYFLTDPPISIDEKFELSVTAWIELPDNIDTLSHEEKRFAFEPYYTEFRDAFYEEFQDFGNSNIHLYSIMPGHIIIKVFMITDEFDFTRLEQFDLKFIHRPKVKPRLIEFQILEE